MDWECFRFDVLATHFKDAFLCFLVLFVFLETILQLFLKIQWAGAHYEKARSRE